MDSVAALPPEDPELFIPNISSEASDGAAVLPAIAIAPPLVAHAGRAYVDRIPAGPIFQSYTTLCTQVQLRAQLGVKSACFDVWPFFVGLVCQ